MKTGYKNRESEGIIEKALFIMAAMGVVGLAGTASASVIITENFSGDSGTSLTSVATPDGNTWVSSVTDRFKQDGSFATGGGVNEASLAFLPFTLTQGYVYALQADIASDPGQEFAALGFSTGVGTSGDYIWDDGADQYAWMLRRGDGGTYSQIEARKGPNAPASDQTKASAAGNTMTIVLDTQNASNYSVTFYEEGAALGPTLSLGSAPAITHIFIGVFDSAAPAFTGSFDNLTLSGNVVPEPSTAIILVLGALCVWGRRRFR